jgi:hypothetical protein
VTRHKNESQKKSLKASDYGKHLLMNRCEPDRDKMWKEYLVKKQQQTELELFSIVPSAEKCAEWERKWRKIEFFLKLFCVLLCVLAAADPIKKPINAIFETARYFNFVVTHFSAYNCFFTRVVYLRFINSSTSYFHNLLIFSRGTEKLTKKKAEKKLEKNPQCAGVYIAVCVNQRETR